MHLGSNNCCFWQPLISCQYLLLWYIKHLYFQGEFDETHFAMVGKNSILLSPKLCSNHTHIFMPIAPAVWSVTCLTRHNHCIERLEWGGQWWKSIGVCRHTVVSNKSSLLCQNLPCQKAVCFKSGLCST